MTGRRPTAVVFDLDGTLLRTNSFHRLVWTLLIRRGPVRPTWTTTWRTWRLTVRRACGMASRVAYKRAVQRLIATDRARTPGSTPFGARFADQLRADLDSTVESCLRLARKHACMTVLSTGALPEYALPLADALGFDLAIATTAAEDVPWTENIGAAKRERTLSALAAAGAERHLKVLVADHEDDVPLATECDVVFWHRAESRRGLCRALVRRFGVKSR